MAGRWNNVPLKEGEEVVYTYTPSFLFLGIAWAIITIVTQGAALPFWLFHYWAYKQNRWAVTNHRVIARTGVFSKKTVSVPAEKITDVTVIRPFLSGIFQTGKVLINTAGSGRRELQIFGQGDPDKVHEEITSTLGV